MLNVTHEKEELDWFERVSSLIKEQLAIIEAKGGKQTDEAETFRRFMWEFAGDLDRVEKIVLGDIADADKQTTQ